MPTPRTYRRKLAPLLALLVIACLGAPTGAQKSPPVSLEGHHEVPDDPFVEVDRATQARSPRRIVTVGPFTSVQVNVDPLTCENIVGDAANEPSIAVDPNANFRMVAGWRQFDTVASNFRQAGWAYSHDGGANWVFHGSLDMGIFRSDPVVGVDNDSFFYYYSLRVPGGNTFVNDMYVSTDWGVTWSAPFFACGGDKAWFTVDRTRGMGEGHFYAFWTSSFSCPGAIGNFNRSTDGPGQWEPEIPVPIQWGTLDVASDGTLSLIGTPGSGFSVLRSSNAQDPGEAVIFDSMTSVDLGGNLQAFNNGPNPGGLLGQAWIASNPTNGNLYALASVDPAGADPLDVHFSRSTDGGTTWSAPVRVNDVATGYQWFGTLSVAPNGRIDVIWNDTRNAGGGLDSELYYSSSTDGGLTWTPNLAMTPAWDPLIGHPQQNKIGDYYDMVSYNDAAHLIYAATFNGEQDVYYLRIPSSEIFEDGFESGDTSAWSTTIP